MEQNLEKYWGKIEEVFNKEVVFTDCPIDPAPFQLVERTSLLKVIVSTNKLVV